MYLTVFAMMTIFKILASNSGLYIYQKVRQISESKRTLSRTAIRRLEEQSTGATNSQNSVKTPIQTIQLNNMEMILPPLQSGSLFNLQLQIAQSSQSLASRIFGVAKH